MGLNILTLSATKSYVAEPVNGSGEPNKIWKTDQNGKPVWADESGGTVYSDEEPITLIDGMTWVGNK